MPVFLFDPTYILIVPALILALYAQQKVHSTFERFIRVPSRAGKTGAQVARELLDHFGLHHVTVEPVMGRLADHYDSRVRAVRLSPEVYRGTSLASLAVAAHETGHAIQHARHYLPLQIRNSLVPVATLGSTLAFPLFCLGFIFAADFGYSLMNLGILLFVAVLAFQIVTLPVEFNASARAMQLLEAGGYLTREERPHAKAVLDAAALTYVAATAVALMHLLRLLVLRNARR